MTIGKDSDEKRDAQPEDLTDEVMQTQHSISQDISLPLTITYVNTKEKVKCRKVKAVKRYTFITYSCCTIHGEIKVNYSNGCISIIYIKVL